MSHHVPYEEHACYSVAINAAGQLAGIIDAEAPALPSPAARRELLVLANQIKLALAKADGLAHRRELSAIRIALGPHQ
jgi:hypothetical protein